MKRLHKIADIARKVEQLEERLDEMVQVTLAELRQSVEAATIKLQNQATANDALTAAVNRLLAALSANNPEAIQTEVNAIKALSDQNNSSIDVNTQVVLTNVEKVPPDVPTGPVSPL